MININTLVAPDKSFLYPVSDKPFSSAIDVTKISCPLPISRKIFPCNFTMFLSLGIIDLYASRPSFPPFNATNGSCFFTSFFNVLIISVDIYGGF